jgi:MoaA/NifB/PqqE/SkfB family radical SAM enzyme
VTPRFNRAALLGFATLLAVAALGTLPAAGAGTHAPSVRPLGYFKPCGTFRFRGRHELFRHSLGCAKAKHKSKYVLRQRRAPRGWRCYLRKRRGGSRLARKKKRKRVVAATCTRGGRAFSFVPYGR